MRCQPAVLEFLVCRRIFSYLLLRPGVRVVVDKLAPWCTKYVSISSVDQLRSDMHWKGLGEVDVNSSRHESPSLAVAVEQF